MINTKKLEVSIIVTCGKEPGDLTHNLEALKKVIGWHELIVIVPGDDDYKMESDGVKMLSCPVASRSFQANMGASLAQGNTLLFLTPETALPIDTISGMKEALKFPSCAGGGFALEFSKKSLPLKLLAKKANRRGNRRSLFMWEQAIFVRKDIFDEIGGFTMTDRVDDFEFCRQMAKFGSLALLHPPVIAREDCHPDRDMLTRLKYRVRGSSAFQSRNWLT